jgi:hypothetical protein
MYLKESKRGKIEGKGINGKRRREESKTIKRRK